MVMEREEDENFASSLSVPEDVQREELEEDKVGNLSSGKPHPHRVKPSGNAWFLDRKDVLHLIDCFGPRIGKLGEDLVSNLIGYLDAESLAQLASTSHGAMVFCSDDSWWRTLALESWDPSKPFRFTGSWKSSFVKGADSSKTAFVPRASLCSDALFQPWQYATADVKKKWVKRQVVDVWDASELSVEDFITKYELPCKPVLIKNALKGEWNLFKLWGSQLDPKRPDRVALLDLEGAETAFRVGPVDMRLCDFLDYSEKQVEESPLYLFDCKFVERIASARPQLCKDSAVFSEELYRVPKYFRNTQEHPHRDLFEKMGSRRPDYRWLIAGAAKSGSKWHIDPNFTHAWNGIVSGSKRWLMNPPGHPPPGVTPSEDGSDVTQPVSLMEWFVKFYQLEQCAVEFTAEAGDLVFVPKGWWHCVLNLEPCVAITQNYISSSNLHQALQLMRDSPHLISGLPCERNRAELYSEFRQALERTCPELLADFDEREEQKRKRRRIAAEHDQEFSFSFF